MSTNERFASHAQNSYDGQTGPVPGCFVVEGPGKYAWVPDTSRSASTLARGHVLVSVAAEIPSPGTMRGYDDGSYAKLNGRTRKGIYMADRTNPDERYPLSIGYAEAGLVSSSRNHAFPAGTEVSADVTFRDQALVEPTEKPNQLWVANPDIHPSLFPLTRKILPIALNPVLHAADAISGDGNLTPDDIYGTIKGNRFLVSGAGPLGLITSKMLQWLGAEQVAIIDIKDQRVALARQMGLDLAFNPLEKGGSKSFAEFMKTEVMPDRCGNAVDAIYGPGPQVIIDFTGSRAAIQNNFDIVQTKGLIVDAGMHRDGQTITNSYQEHSTAADTVRAQIGNVPRRQFKAWGRTRDPLSMLGEAFLMGEDRSREDGRTNGDTLRRELYTHVGTFSDAPAMYSHIMQDRVEDLRDWEVKPNVQTTGYVLLLNDRLRGDVVERYRPDSPMRKSSPQREVIQLQTKK